MTSDALPDESTQVSLLDSSRWEEFDSMYRPFVRKWLRILQIEHGMGLPHEDIDDLEQDILLHVQKKLPGFEHRRRKGSFRAWLRIVITNLVRSRLRTGKNRPKAAGGSDAQELLAKLEDDRSGVNRRFEDEYDRHVLQQLLARVCGDFAPKTWEAFKRVTLKEESVADVAVALAISKNAVRVAKSRVIQRLREFGEELVTSSMTLAVHLNG